MLLMIDNYDSFTYNLVQYFQHLNQEVVVYTHDQISLEQIKKLNPSYLVISPGPKAPDDAGISMQAIKLLNLRPQLRLNQDRKELVLCLQKILNKK